MDFTSGRNGQEKEVIEQSLCLGFRKFYKFQRDGLPYLARPHHLPTFGSLKSKDLIVNGG